ncbi:MAG: hypothetical protein A2Y36_02980 [Treponema sp. GWA1_62_8]|nr:MAG: hypothetical protein A2Y36_02980 [Treponema sp. GWA1_62_8]
MRVFGALFDKPIVFALGPSPDLTPSPDRLRREYLVRFIVLIESVLLFSFVFGFAFDMAIGARASAALLLLACFALLRAGKYPIAVDLLFFGGVGGTVLGAVLIFVSGGDLKSWMPLVMLVLFAATSLGGLFFSSAARVTWLLVITLIVDMAPFITQYATERTIMHAQTGIMILHLIAYGIGRFLFVYFDRVSRLAQARRVMIQGLEGLVSDTRASGIAQLESFGHDIRSPITAIIGVQSLLSSTALNAEQQSYVDILGRSNRLLLELVESVLDPRIDSDSPPHPIRKILEAAVDPYRPIARSRGLTLKVRVAGAQVPSPLARADFLRLVGNLVDNALKYTDSGSIVVSASVPEGASPPVFVLSVSDTGRGIPADRLVAVRSGLPGPDGAVSASHGLGLEYARSTVKAAGGSLDIDSVSGIGTTVAIRLPVHPGARLDSVSGPAHSSPL